MDKDLANGAHNWENRISITPAGFFGTSSDQIQARENFMTDEEKSFLLNAAKSINTWDRTETHYNDDGVVIYDSLYWDNRVASRPILDEIDPEISLVIEKLVARLKIEVDAFFNVDAKPTSPAIVRWMPGYKQEPHADKPTIVATKANANTFFIFNCFKLLLNCFTKIL